MCLLSTVNLPWLHSLTKTIMPPYLPKLHFCFYCFQSWELSTYEVRWGGPMHVQPFLGLRRVGATGVWHASSVWVLDKVTPRVRFWVFKKFSKKRSNCLTCYQSLGFGYSDTSRGEFNWAHHRIYQDNCTSTLFLVSDCRSIKAFSTLAKTDLYTHGEGVERGEKVYGVIPSQRPNPSSIPHVHYPQINDAKPKGLPSPISSKSLCWQTGLKFSHFTFAVNNHSNPIIPSLFTESQRPSGKHLYKLSLYIMKKIQDSGVRTVETVKPLSVH